MYNERENQLDLQLNNPETEFNYNPQTTLTKPRVKTTVIKDPVIHNPPNVPDHELFPPRDTLYNPNIDIVKPSTKIGGLFEPLEKAKFRLKEKEKEMLSEFLAMQNRIPDPGFYEPVFTLIDEGVPIPDFGRYLRRSDILTRSEIMEMSQEGDNLILDLDKKKKIKGMVELNRMVGRDPGEIEDAGVSLVGSEVYLRESGMGKKPKIKGYVELVIKYNNINIFRGRKKVGKDLKKMRLKI